MRHTQVELVSNELSQADFGDKRLSRRLGVMARALAASPGDSLPKSMQDNACLEGAYRFLGSAKVNGEKILEPHIKATAARVREAGVAYCVSDTTEFRFGGEDRRGLGRLQGRGRGFLEHIAIAVAADGSRHPLGVLARKTIVRPASKKRRSGTTISRRADDSESRKWFDVADAAERAVGSERCLIHLMDREADIYALLAGLCAHRRRFVVRLGQNRNVVDDEEVVRLFDALDEAKQRVQRDVGVCAQPRPQRGRQKRERRVATLTLSARSVVVCRAKAADPALPRTIEVNVVHVRENDPPPGEEPIDWKLVTSEPIASDADLERVVDAYRTRWVIEEYFKALKTGCTIESKQLESLRTIHNLLAIMMPIAIQMLALRSLADSNPAASAARVLTANELRALRLMSRAKLSARPTAKEALYAVASLGGYIKNNGAPGWQVLSRGYLCLLRYAEVLDAVSQRGKA